MRSRHKSNAIRAPRFASSIVPRVMVAASPSQGAWHIRSRSGTSANLWRIADSSVISTRLPKAHLTFLLKIMSSRRFVDEIVVVWSNQTGIFLFVRLAAGEICMRRLSICLILPRFEPSYFGREYMLPILPGDKRCMMIGGGLPLLAALVPERHRVTILDENVEKIDFAAVRDFDVVGVTGMIVQKQRMEEILDELR